MSSTICRQTFFLSLSLSSIPTPNVVYSVRLLDPVEFVNMSNSWLNCHFYYRIKCFRILLIVQQIDYNSYVDGISSFSLTANVLAPPPNFCSAIKTRHKSIHTDRLIAFKLQHEALLCRRIKIECGQKHVNETLRPYRI